MSHVPSVPSLTLNNGVTMPQLGFGVYRVPDDEAASTVTAALEAGYRSIDTAALYENERGTGAAVTGSGLPREEVFVTTKLWNTGSAPWTRDGVFREFDASLARLGLDYLDLYLIHWPRPMREESVAVWRAFGELLETGRTRAAGVSNFNPGHLDRLIEETGVTPSVNQIELHPLLQQPALRAYGAEHGIATEAWAPLARGRELFTDPVIVGLAAKHERTPAQIVLRWHLQLGNAAIPKSVTPSRIRENIAVFDFVLDDRDMAALASLDTGTRLGPDPEVFEF